MIGTILFIITLIGIFIYTIINYFRKNKQSKEIYDQLSHKQQEELKKEYEKGKEEYEVKFSKLVDTSLETIKKLKHEQETEANALEIIRKFAQAESDSRRQAIAEAKEMVDSQIRDYRTAEMDKVKVQIEQERMRLQQTADSVLLEYTKIQDDRRAKIDEEIKQITTQLDEYKSKRDAINEQIRKEEELENQLETHTIRLASAAKDDISYLISIEPNLHNQEILRKLIWSTYLQPEVNEMFKKQFGANIPKNVIYCIEHIDSHKKYIGKTQSEITKRWTDHLKSSLNIGTISHQAIHSALYKNWDQFAFYVLEETTKENLNEREKYYIKFYETDKYGFNLKKGG